MELAHAKKQNKTHPPGHNRHTSVATQYSGVRSILRQALIQPKLQIGAPEDKYEQEADLELWCELLEDHARSQVLWEYLQMKQFRQRSEP